MNTEPSQLITSVPEFLAHAILLERESVERYEELADSMETHNNLEVAQLFRKLAHFGELHAHEVEHHAEGMELPEIPPWDFKWSTPESPESGAMEEVHYLMGTREALEFALHNETRGRDFYAHVAETSPDPEVRRMAAEFTAEETEHVNILKSWLLNLTDAGEEPLEDLDPPNVTE
ncbi:MAG TPA: rubrerythrin [Sedimenticola thiotaurini]|uniref:Rubrerythrin n=1 Tax=Sedimenticola thiotaurini TaxID=1543721 RepID=A0A831RML7_9GAMM|nr:rubrerythrin [Sedimenticola thiotaurini]